MKITGIKTVCGLTKLASRRVNTLIYLNVRTGQVFGTNMLSGSYPVYSDPDIWAVGIAYGPLSMKDILESAEFTLHKSKVLNEEHAQFLQAQAAKQD